MQEAILNRQKYSYDKIMHFFLLAYLFLLLFPHTSTLKEITFWGAFISWVVIRLKKREPFVPLNHINISLLTFLFIVFVASIFSMDPLENIINFKGEILIPVILFLMIATEVGEEQIKKNLSVLVCSIGVYTLLMIIESTEKGLSCFWGGDNGADFPWKVESSLYFPITLGLLLFAKNKFFKIVIGLFAFIEILLIALDKQITVFFGAIMVVLFWVLFVRPKRYRIWMLACIISFIGVLGLLYFNLKDNPAMKEFDDKLGKIMHLSEEINNEHGLSDRMALWEAASDIIKERPLLGYGAGIKKFVTLSHSDHFSLKWKQDKPIIYELLEKKLPHNIFLDIAIQGGLLGVGSLLVFIAAYIFYITRAAIRSKSDQSRNLLIILIGGIFTLFMITNLFNSEFNNASGKLFFAILGAGAALIKDDYALIGFHKDKT